MVEARRKGLRGPALREFMDDSDQVRCSSMQVLLPPTKVFVSHLGSFFVGQLRQPVTMADFEESVHRVNSSVGGQDLAKFAKWMEDYGAA